MTLLKKQKETRSLLWLFLIIGIGTLISMSFVLFILQGYKKPRPLVIKPSSVKSFQNVAHALYKSMYPLTKQGYRFQVHPMVNDIEVELAKEMKKYFPNNTSQNKSRKDKSRKDKSRKDKSREDESREDESRKGESRKGESRENKSGKNESNKTISVTLVKVDLNSKPPPPSQFLTCQENNLFNLYRKKEKKWKKKIYFSICKESDNSLILSYTQSDLGRD